MMGNLFNKYSLHDFINSFRESLIAKIDKYEITDSTEVNTLVEALKEEFTIYPLDVKEAKPSEPIETKMDSANMYGETYKKKVIKVEVIIPFAGNRDLFDCMPSTSTVVYIDRSVSIHSAHVSATILLDDLDPNQYKNALDKIIRDLTINIPRINSEIAPWNNELEQNVKQLLEQRKGVVSKKFDFMEKIGLKVNPKSNDFMIPPPVAKKTIPVPVSETSKSVKKEIVPILQEEVYKDIKEVLYNVGKAIERKPSIYLNKQEEDLRDVFLLFLETRYESTGGVGEAFNKKGKTDILLKYAKDGSNLFVAECKFWKGQKKLFEGINQLLGYLTHRDSKTALMIFVDQKEFTSVITTLKSEIRNHKNFKRFIKDSYESSFSYEFSLPDDSQKTIQLEIMLYHFPK
jgi:hypothetical protein